jgi:hypothetical protein
MTTKSLLSLLDPSPTRRLRALQGLREGPGLFALRTVLFFDPHASVRAAAASRLGVLGSPEPCRWLLLALQDPSPQVRFCVLRSLARVGPPEVGPVARRLREDPCWWVRRAAALTLAALGGGEAVARLRESLDDPMWRVRLGVVQALALLAEIPENRAAILAPLVDAPLHAHLAHEHLRALLTGTIPTARTLTSADPPPSPLEDDDPAVTTARLAATPRGSIEPTRLLHLLADPHGPLRFQVLRHLSSNLDERARDELEQRYRDPRLPHANAALRRLLGGPPLPWPRTSPESLALPTQEDPWTRAAALDLDRALAAISEDPDPWLRRHAATLLERELHAPGPSLAAASALARSPDPFLRVRAAILLERCRDEGLALALQLFGDADLTVRSAALDALARQRPEAAEEALRGERLSPLERRSALLWLIGCQNRPDAITLARGPEETRLVSLLRGEPVAELSDPTPTGPGASATPSGSMVPPDPAPSRWSPGEAPRAVLGATGVELSRLVLSGKNEPPGRGLTEAYERGVTSFFWEPGYRNLTRFLRDERPGPRAVIAGTYHADATSIERDVDHVLRRLHTDTIEVFLLFWARSSARLTGEPLEALRRLKERGKVRAVGFSTHLRGVAEEALERGGWDVVMTRHSAAHRGAEERLFPAARRLGVGVLSFSNLCYGRLLAPVPGETTTPATAADCYRYSLATPGVSASLSAPRSLRELREGLDALENPGLSDEKRAALLAHGAAAYALGQHRNGLVRQAPTTHRPGVRSLALEALDLAAPTPEAHQARQRGGHGLDWENPSPGPR